MGATSSQPQQRETWADDVWATLRYRPFLRPADPRKPPPTEPERAAPPPTPRFSDSESEGESPARAKAAQPELQKENTEAQTGRPSLGGAGAAGAARLPLSPFPGSDFSDNDDDGGGFLVGPQSDDDADADDSFDCGGFGGFGDDDGPCDLTDDEFGFNDAAATLSMFDDMEAESLASFRPSVQQYPASGVGVTLAVGGMQGRRDSMEDSFAAAPDAATGPDPLAWVGVFDGHGGTAAAEVTAQALLAQIQRTAEFEAGALQKASAVGFLEFDAQLRQQRGEELQTCGTTAVTAFVTRNQIVVASAGDSRALLGRGGCVVPLSRDHAPAMAEEAARIEAAGGKVSFGRVNGALAVSRAFGDFAYKRAEGVAPERQAVTCAPETCIVERDAAADEFLLLACDGIFEALDNEGLARAVRAGLEARRGQMPAGEAAAAVAADVLQQCFDGGSEDNMTLSVGVFEGWWGGLVGGGGGE